MHFSVVDWANIASGVLAVSGAVFVGLKWLIKHYLSELRPNHGSSLHDKINKEIIPLLSELKAGIADIRNEITGLKVDGARLEGRFDQHIDDNL